MASKKSRSKQNAPKFCMDEDFPALPTIHRHTFTKSGRGPEAGAADTDWHVLSAHTAAATTSSISSSADVSNSVNHSTASSNSTSSTALHSSQSVQLLGNDHITNIPDEMVKNQFGMLSLLKLLNIGPEFLVFTPGFDLSRQNLANLPPYGEMHHHTLPPHEAEHDVPAEYRIHHRIAGRLPPDPPLDKLADETLFWIFYNLCGEEAQLVAAKELYNRNWRYHKKKMWWLTYVPGSDVIREGSVEKGTFYCWDPQHLRKSIQCLTICYADLDDTPTTYRLSSPTLNARVQYISSNPHQ